MRSGSAGGARQANSRRLDHQQGDEGASLAEEGLGEFDEGGARSGLHDGQVDGGHVARHHIAVDLLREGALLCGQVAGAQVQVLVEEGEDFVGAQFPVQVDADPAEHRHLGGVLRGPQVLEAVVGDHLENQAAGRGGKDCDRAGRGGRSQLFHSLAIAAVPAGPGPFPDAPQVGEECERGEGGCVDDPHAVLHVAKLAEVVDQALHVVHLLADRHVQAPQRRATEEFVGGFHVVHESIATGCRARKREEGDSANTQSSSSSSLRVLHLSTVTPISRYKDTRCFHPCLALSLGCFAAATFKVVLQRTCEPS